MKIDSDATIPLSWFLTALVAVIAWTLAGAFWISAVNYRLSRIEDKLGIPKFAEAVPPLMEIESHADDDSKRLRSPVQKLNGH